jgi:hypothetical protein
VSAKLDPAIFDAIEKARAQGAATCIYTPDDLGLDPAFHRKGLNALDAVALYRYEVEEILEIADPLPKLARPQVPVGPAVSAEEA